MSSTTLPVETKKRYKTPQYIFVNSPDTANLLYNYLNKYNPASARINKRKFARTVAQLDEESCNRLIGYLICHIYIFPFFKLALITFLCLFRINEFITPTMANYDFYCSEPSCYIYSNYLNGLPLSRLMPSKNSINLTPKELPIMVGNPLPQKAELVEIQKLLDNLIFPIVVTNNTYLYEKQLQALRNNHTRENEQFELQTYIKSKIAASNRNKKNQKQSQKVKKQSQKQKTQKTQFKRPKGLKLMYSDDTIRVYVDKNGEEYYEYNLEYIIGYLERNPHQLPRILKGFPQLDIERDLKPFLPHLFV